VSSCDKDSIGYHGTKPEALTTVLGVITVATIERTAYPRFKQSLTQDELEEFYTPTEAEVVFVSQAASGKPQQLALTILLKSFQKLGYLPRLSRVPEQIQTHIAQTMGWLLPPAP
jgi:hypothetical protein